MKKLIIVFLLNIFCLTFLFAGNDGNSKDKWEILSQNLVKSLKSDNPGVRQSAMQLIIEHSNQLNVQDGVLDVMNIFRSSKDPKVRTLALITLSKMKSDLAINLLSMHYRFEKNDNIQKKIKLVLAEHNNMSAQTQIAAN